VVAERDNDTETKTHARKPATPRRTPKKGPKG
jgi:hypothetical protein